MIRLIDILKEVQQDQQVDEGWKDVALGTAMTAASVFGGAKAQSKIPTDKPAITTTKQGTSVDGIIGKYTSQFRFPGAFLKDLNAGTIKNLGTEGNDALTSIRGTGVDKTDMDQWNRFVDWMEKEGYSGKTDMNHIEYSNKVLNQYRKEHPEFWIKDTNDIKTVQKIIKDYRTYTISSWLKGGMQIDMPVAGGGRVSPKNQQDVERVMKNYMMWAK